MAMCNSDFIHLNQAKVIFSAHFQIFNVFLQQHYENLGSRIYLVKILSKCQLVQYFTKIVREPKTFSFVQKYCLKVVCKTDKTESLADKTEVALLKKINKATNIYIAANFRYPNPQG